LVEAVATVDIRLLRARPGRDGNGLGSYTRRLLRGGECGIAVHSHVVRAHRIWAHGTEKRVVDNARLARQLGAVMTSAERKSSGINSLLHKPKIQSRCVC